MSLLTIIFVIVFFGVLIYAINRWLPMDPQLKQLLTAVVIIGIVIWLFIGIFGSHFPDIRIGG